MPGSETTSSARACAASFASNTAASCVCSAPCYLATLYPLCRPFLLCATWLAGWLALHLSESNITMTGPRVAHTAGKKRTILPSCTRHLHASRSGSESPAAPQEQRACSVQSKERLAYDLVPHSPAKLSLSQGPFSCNSASPSSRSRGPA